MKASCRTNDGFLYSAQNISNDPAYGSRSKLNLAAKAITALLLVFFLGACPSERRTHETVEQADRIHEEADDPATDPENGEDEEIKAEDSESDEVDPETDPEADAETDSDEADEADEDEGTGQSVLGPHGFSPAELVPGEGRLWGIMRTSKGAIVIRFLEDEAPLTVANFVGLALGKIPYINSETNEVEQGRFYDGLIFHRVIPGFMIQGGDPAGNGTGGPGYSFECEEQTISFNRTGLLAMANSGRDTNGSQFFITERVTPHLSGRHTIFGSVERGLDVAKKIARVPRDRMDRPLEPVTIETIEIFRSNTRPEP